MYDLAQWFVGNKIPTGFHLEGVNLAGQKVIQVQSFTSTSLVFIKTMNGYPWDVKRYDQQWIYDTLTESDTQGWSNPRNYKLNGWPMLPRYWNGDPTWSYYQQQALAQNYQNCIKSGNPIDVGPVSYTLQGPFAYDFQGDIGTQLTILASFYWKSPANREQLFLCEAFGWVTWTHATMLPNGLYSIDSKSVHNKIVAGTCKVNFPCPSVI